MCKACQKYSYFGDTHDSTALLRLDLCHGCVMGLLCLCVCSLLFWSGLPFKTRKTFESFRPYEIVIFNVFFLLYQNEYNIFVYITLI